MSSSFVPFYAKQHHTTSLLDDTNEMTSVKNTSPELSRLNKDIQNHICVHKRQKWRDFVETMDQKTDLTKLWRTVKGIDGRAKREAENKAIQQNFVLIVQAASHQVQLTVQYFKLGRHTFSRETRVVTRETIGDGANIHLRPSNESNQEL